MQKLGLACPLGFLSGRPQRTKTSILDLNYDCIVEIYSYLSALEDKLNLTRAHSQFCAVFASLAVRRFAKINMRMLRSISDWDYLFRMCGKSVLECELRHGRWDDNITQPFITLLNSYCKNLRHLHLIFAHSDMKPVAEGSDLNILELLHQKDLISVSLIDARAAAVLQLQHFKELEALHIDGFDVDLTNADFVKLFQSLPKLRRLSLRFASRRQLPPLSAHCPLLEHLSLENFDGTLDDVGDFPNLKSLCLLWRLHVSLNYNLFRSLVKRYSDCLEQLQLTRVSLEHVDYIIALKKLKSFACHMWPNEALSSVSQLNKLECLDVQSSDPTAQVMQLLDVIANCTQLQHLKLGKRWQQSELELESFVCNAQEELRKQVSTGVIRQQLLLTLNFEISTELQNRLRKQLNPQYMRLDSLCAVCLLCKPDRHTKQSIPGLI